MTCTFHSLTSIHDYWKNHSFDYADMKGLLYNCFSVYLDTFSPELPLTGTVSSFISDTDIIGDLLHDYVYMLQHTHTLSYFLKKTHLSQSHFSEKSYASNHFILTLLASDGYKNGNTGISTMRDSAPGKD